MRLCINLSSSGVDVLIPIHANQGILREERSAMLFLFVMRDINHRPIDRRISQGGRLLARHSKGKHSSERHVSVTNPY